MKPYELGQLFALPIQSAIRAQNLALQETVSFIERFGVEEGVAKTFHLTAERMVEERTIDPKTGDAETELKAQPFEMRVPLLALVSPPSIQLQEMNVEFGVEIVEPRSEPIESALIQPAMLGSSLAPSMSLFSSLNQSNPTTMKVNMKIVREIPEGMARLGDVLTDLLSGHSPAVHEELPPKKYLAIEEIPGIGPERGALLRRKGIITVTDLVRVTETAAAIEDLAKSTGVSAKRIREWRKKAKTLY